MSVQRFKTAQIIEVEIVAEEDFFVVIGKAGEKHPSGWQYTGNNYRLSLHTNFGEAYDRCKRLRKAIRTNPLGCVPRTVPRDLDTYLLP